MSRGNKNKRINVEARKAKILKLGEENPDSANWTHEEIADAIGAANRDAVGRDLRELAIPLVVANAEQRERARIQQRRIYELMEKALIEGRLPTDIVREWRSIRSEISTLDGLNAPEKKIVANVDATNTTVQYQFLERMNGRMDRIADVFAFIDSLPRATARIADIFPPRQLGDGQ